MDLSDAAHILGMDLRPTSWYDDDPQPVPSGYTDEDVESGAIEGYPVHEDAFGTVWADLGPMDPPGGDHCLVIRYDTITDLEANLIAMAVGQFIRSKTPAHNITTTYTKEG
jgi:hypothetical protein